MTALTGDRPTTERETGTAEFPLKANATVYAGGITAVTAAGEALRPQDAGAALIVGCALNGSGTMPSGIVVTGPPARIRVRRRRQFAYANSSGADLIDASTYGATIYAVDDQTVAKTNGGGARLAAGVCRGVDGAGVWVEFG